MGIEISLSEEVLKELENKSKLLNGQIRGVINLRARNENLQLIQLTLGSIYQQAYSQGCSDMINEISEQQIKEDLKNDIKEDIKDGYSPVNKPVITSKDP